MQITPCHILSMSPALIRLRILLAPGHGLTVRHYRNGTEVAPSIDQDLNYDFNYQQYRSVTPRKVMPVSALLIKKRSSISDTQSIDSQSLSEPCYSFLSITLHREMSLNWNATTGALIGTAHYL